MNLFEIEEKRKMQEQNKKLNKMMIIAIAVVVVIMVVLYIGISYLKSNPDKWTVTIDGKTQSGLVSELQIEELTDGTFNIYVPIKVMAEYLNYKSFNGTPEVASENTDNCYARNDYEIVTFETNSKIIYKKDLTTTDAEYEYCVLSKEVTKNENDELILDMEGLAKAFNMTYFVDKDKKTLKIYTLEYWVSYANKLATGEYKYAEMDITFVNEKAILDDMIVVKSDEGYYGVIEYSTGNSVLGAQYEQITYIPENSAFLVKKDGKTGIISSNGETKIEAVYDSLSLIDNERKLYLASSDGLYGVVDINGNTIINIEYSRIGIDVSNFAKNNIKAGYILLDTLIPVQQNEKWGLFDVEGNKVSDTKYDGIGSISTSRTSLQYNLLVIPEYNVIVVQKNGAYGFMNLQGKEVIGLILSDVYIETSGRESTYKMERDDKIYEVSNILDQLGVKKVEE